MTLIPFLLVTLALIIAFWLVNYVFSMPTWLKIVSNVIIVGVIVLWFVAMHGWPVLQLHWRS